jgi:hypothetical protein
MKRLAMAALLVACACHPAAAENCTRSLDYILSDLAGPLPLPASSYQALARTCLETLKLGNVKDAYVLRDGGIAVLPRDAGVLATANTLAQFCRSFPDDKLRFITRREARHGLTTGLVVAMASDAAGSCAKIR